MILLIVFHRNPYTDETFDAWQPDPADASARSDDEEDMIEQNDPLARLFDVYGSREAYANEYRKMLGHKLLTSQERGADVEREIWNVEMFKARFGSEAMQDCSVMLKDIADTKRIMATTAKDHSGVNQDIEFIIMSKVSIFVPVWLCNGRAYRTLMFGWILLRVFVCVCVCSTALLAGDEGARWRAAIPFPGRCHAAPETL